MPRRCVAIHCGHEKDRLFMLSTIEPPQRKQWIAFVKAKRAYWEPSETSCLCFKHFEDACFDNLLKYQQGYATKLLLTKNAVPTLHSSDPDVQVTPKAKRQSSAYQKRERFRLFSSLETPKPNNPTIPTQTDDKVTVSTATQTDPWIPDQTPKTDAAVQCTLGLSNSEPFHKKNKLLVLEDTSDTETSESEDEIEWADDPKDEDYRPQEDMEIGESEDEDEDHNAKFDEIRQNPGQSPLEEDKYIVFESCLLSLLSICMRCGGPSTCFKKVLGTMLSVKTVCEKCGCRRDWDSHPRVAGRSIFNVLLSGAILFTGSLPTKVLRLFQTLKIKCHVRRTFYRHQRNLLHNAVQKTWDKCQSALLVSIKDTELVLGGDGRCDSMGHSAKFGCYVIMEMNLNKVLSTEIVQKNEVPSSNHMELEGLKKSLPMFDEYNVKALVTDRHPMVQKWLRENSAVTHLFDCWHVVKGLCKKLEELAKKKARRPIRDWIKSIKYHLYWCVMSSRLGDKEGIKKKWLSCVDHIQNKHEGCSHGPLEKQKLWLREGTEACDTCVDALTDPRLLKDLLKMSPLGQTSGVESYNSLFNHFAPKMVQFSYNGMISRSQLAALHYNENAGRPQAVTQDGKEQYRIDFPRGKSGGYVVRKVLVGASYGYVAACFENLIEAVVNEKSSTPSSLRKAQPDPVSSQFVKPVIEEAVKGMRSRFIVTSPHDSES